MRIDTAADGVITGTATINKDLITAGKAMSPCNLRLRVLAVRRFLPSPETRPNFRGC